MQGGIEKAREYLGLAKVKGGLVAEQIVDIVENKGCCVVFCDHHSVSSELSIQLNNKKIGTKIVDGRVDPKERDRIARDFQAGIFQVFIGGIRSASEAIDLFRADSVVFVELDWVPANLLQAEGRIHRLGQKNHCQIYQLIARMPGENLDELMIGILGSKMEKIGKLLDESTENVVGNIKKDILDRLVQGRNACSESNATHQENEDSAIIIIKNGFKTIQSTERHANNQEKILKKRIDGAERSRKFRQRHKCDDKAEKMKIQTKERVRRFREKHGEDYRVKHRDYLRRWRKERKANEFFRSILTESSDQAQIHGAGEPDDPSSSFSNAGASDQEVPHNGILADAAKKVGTDLT